MLRGNLAFMHSSSQNEFWSALLEKAYAKLYGSYEAISGGLTTEALEDLIGGVALTYELDNPPKNLFTRIEKGFERGSLMGCSINAHGKVIEEQTPEGLVIGHAYTVTKVQVLEALPQSPRRALKLIRIRNPWGNEVEWNGAWSDKSTEWRQVPSNLRAEIGLTIDNDGEFWMRFKDFLKYFDILEICHLSPESFKFDDEDVKDSCEKEWILNSYEGEWIAGISAGGCENHPETYHLNPQYVMTLNDPDEDDNDDKCTVIVALMQKNRRVRRHIGVKNLSIGFSVFKVEEQNLIQIPLKMSFFKKNNHIVSSDIVNSREICCRFKLPKANYIVVPSTFDQNYNGEFILRVFTEGSCCLKEHDRDTIWIGVIDDKIPIQYPEESEIKKKFDEAAESNLEIGWMELRRFLGESIVCDCILNYVIIVRINFKNNFNRSIH